MKDRFIIAKTVNIKLIELPPQWAQRVRRC